jgi:hypothetical protein
MNIAVWFQCAHVVSTKDDFTCCVIDVKVSKGLGHLPVG